MRVLPPSRGTNFCVAESKSDIYFLQHENLLREKVVIRATNNLNLQRQHCCTTSCKNMLPVLLGLYLKNQKVTIFNLQETFSKQEDEKAWSAEWGGKILFSHGSEHSKGVTILVNPNSTFQLSTVEIDSHGRYIIAKLQIEETILHTYIHTSCFLLTYMHQMSTANKNNSSEL